MFGPPPHASGSTLVWVSGVAGIITAWILATILVVARPVDLMVAVGYWIFATFLALPFGLLAGLAALGAGLGSRWLVSRATGANGVLAAAAALVGVLVAGTGMAVLVACGAFPDMAPYLWVAIASSALGGLALYIWSISAQSGVGRETSAEPTRIDPR